MQLFKLNPNIHIWSDDIRVLLYDINQKKQFIFDLDSESRQLIDALKDIRNLNTLSLEPNQINAEVISKMIKNNLGRIINTQPSEEEKTLPPMYYFSHRMNTDEKLTSRVILMYVKVITIYLSGRCTNMCTHCDTLYKQGHYCINQSTSLSKMNREIVISRIKGLTNLSKINLVFSSINDDSLCFAKELSTSGAILLCHIHWKNITPSILDEMLSWNGVVIIKVLIDLSEITQEQLEKVIDLQSQHKNIVILVFCVTSEKDFDLLQENYHRTIKENVEVRYVYTGREKDHIIKHYLLEDSDLQQITTDNNRIFGNRELNFSLFGELVISPDGTIRLNQNTEVIGTISDDWVEMLNNALNKPNPWLMTRNKTKPCSNCIYRDLCPPIRNLELFMGDKLACVDFYKKLPSPNE